MKQEAVKKHFDSYSQSWDKMYNGHPIDKYMTNTRLEHILTTVKKLDFSRTDKLNIIEFGCGTGVLLSALEEYFFNSDLIGVDISEQMLAVAKEKCKKSTLIVGSVDEYKSDKKFDLIILIAVSEYLPKWEDTINMLKKLLTPEGKIIMTFTNGLSFTSTFDRIYRRFFQKKKDTTFKRRFASYWQVYNYGKKNGLKIDSSTKYSFDMYTMKYMLGQNKSVMLRYEKFLYKADKLLSNKLIGNLFARAFIIQFSIDKRKL